MVIWLEWDHPCPDMLVVQLIGHVPVPAQLLLSYEAWGGNEMFLGTCGNLDLTWETLAHVDLHSQLAG